MQYANFIRKVKERGHLDREHAIRATSATLRTLTDRLTIDEAKDFLSQLPKEIKEMVTEKAIKVEPERLSLDEFINRVSLLDGCGKEACFSHARAVMQTLSEAISSGEMNDIKAQLPRNFEPLIPGAGQHPA